MRLPDDLGEYGKNTGAQNFFQENVKRSYQLVDVAVHERMALRCILGRRGKSCGLIPSVVYGALGWNLGNSVGHLRSINLGTVSCPLKALHLCFKGHRPILSNVRIMIRIMR
jgi:hypothetical protein